MDPTIILKLRALRDDLARIVADLEAPLKLVQPVAAPNQHPLPSAPWNEPTQEPQNQGLLPNPYIGPIANITWREIPTKFGPKKLFELHAAGVKIGTLNEKDAEAARQASSQNARVSIVWKTRTNEKNGKTYTNYDLVSLTVPKSQVN